ncbi:ABC transporter ATP-binding protein [Paraburkholderia sp. NPDC080076]|uniref:ABC transporter ATP-binding protein n=1 Tax=Paraburkholderia sp. NPDC080076 TaxID=3390605 RepID=UPI003D00D1C9
MSRGHITQAGRDTSSEPSWNMAAKGVALLPEGRMIFRDMTIEENLMMGAFAKPCRHAVRTHLERDYELFPLLRERSPHQAGTLSGGQAQMLAMGRGFISDPKVLLIDEPSLGLSPVMVREVFDILKRLKSEGRTILLVEQNTHIALDVADHVYLMQGGEVTLSKPAAEVNLTQFHDLYFSR